VAGAHLIATRISNSPEEAGRTSIVSAGRSTQTDQTASVVAVASVQ
jgi:hypothetical protein